MNLPPDRPPWSRAGAEIWALVSGLPTEKRCRQPLLMLQAFIDESVDSNPPVYAMAGFLASSEQWVAFSDEWQQFLDMRPRIRYFKMQEAMQLDGEFKYWREEARDKKLRLLMGVIDDHVQLGVWNILSHAEYAELFKDDQLPKRMQSPYYFLFYGMMQDIIEHADVAGEDRPIDFVFDQQVMEKDRVLRDLELFRLTWPGRKERIGKNVTFGDDLRVLPLQAADMLAWIARTDAQKRLRAESPIPLPAKIGGKPDRPVIGYIWDRDTLRATRELMRHLRTAFADD